RRLPRQLEHLAVEEEEPGQPELVDQPQLVLEPSSRLSPKASRALRHRVTRAVALVESVAADLRELLDRGLLTVREVGIAVAELLRQVELEPCGELCGALGRLLVEREALEHLLGRPQDALPVPSPFRLAPLERGAA